MNNNPDEHDLINESIINELIMFIYVLSTCLQINKMSAIRN